MVLQQQETVSDERVVRNAADEAIQLQHIVCPGVIGARRLLLLAVFVLFFIRASCNCFL
jgi:hypothetical protein